MTGEAAPVIWWVRKDLRLGDNPALAAAAEFGAPVIPVFILDEVFDGYGACPLWRFGLGVGHLADTLAGIGSRLVLRRGAAVEVLTALCHEVGASRVRWSRAYDPDQVTRDKRVKAALADAGVDGASVAGHLLHEPWDIKTGTGGFYRVYTPFWRNLRDRPVGQPLAAPTGLLAPEVWPETDDLADWALAAAMGRGADVVAQHVHVGEEVARERLDHFLAEQLEAYGDARDFPARDATSGMSEHLAWGEISPRVVWHAGVRAMEEGNKGAEKFLKELAWREFAYHLVWHTPHMVETSWREGWDSFPWNEDERLAEVRRWKQGMTGEPFVDAAMREMYVTGVMHNRARMIVASYLTKHLLCHWRIGQAWFADCLIDWDPASNAMGWQWVAGSGPDAAPYFRVFNPATQVEKFDKGGAYRARWIAEGARDPSDTALSYFDAVPKSWNLSPEDDYPEPVVDLGEGRKRALAAYEARDF